MPNAVARTSSGEILKIHPTQLFARYDTAYFTILIDPPFPDGTENREDLGDGRLGDPRVAGWQKIWDGVDVRNALQAEIDGLQALEDADIDLQHASRAKILLRIQRFWRRIFKAIIRKSVDENNLMAAQWNTFRAEVELSNNLGDFKARVRDNTTDVPIRTYAQGYDSFEAEIDTEV